MTSRKISSQPPPSRLGIESGRWLLSLVDPQPNEPSCDSAVCHEAFLDWLETSPQHVQVFIETFETYRRLGAIDPLGLINIPALLRQVADPPSARREATERRARPGTRAPLGIGRFFRASKVAHWAVGTVAAVIVPIVVGAWPLFEPRNATATPLTYSTAVGERKTVSLPEGSVLTLNTASRVEVTIDRRRRSVQLLEGEVHVAVHHESDRPFEVVTQGVKVLDLGTQFDVYRRSTGVRVTVIEGQVRILSDHSRIAQDHSQNSAAALSAGEQADISTNPEPATISTRRLTAAQILETIGWKEGKIYFHGEPLREVVGEFNRYNTRRLIIADPQIASLQVGGVFATTPDTRALVEVLHRTWGIEVLPPGPSNADPQTIRLGLSTAHSRQP
jgi:transmembrane sensor